jgi:hypothetical protein
MRKLLVIFIVVGFIFIGCSEPGGEYSVIYHADDNDTYGYPPIDSKKYKYDEEAVVLGKYTLGNKHGYAFKNWNTSRDGKGTSYEPGGIIKITGTIFLHAIWEAE